jgi:phage terminase large subunit
MSKPLYLTLPQGLEGKYMTFLTDDRFTEMAFIGGFGTAKTDALVTSVLRDAYEYPGATLVLLRDELVNLKRTTLADLLSKAPELTAHHSKTESVITFHPVKCADGVVRTSKLYCFGLMTGDYKQKLKSLQPFRIYIDEADKVYEEMVDMCVLRIRQKAYHRESGKLGKNQVKIVANDEGNNWIWRRFIGKPHPGMAMDPEWAQDNVGIKEDYFSPKTYQDVLPKDIAIYDGVRRVVESVGPEGIRLTGMDEPVDPSRLSIVGQRLCIYAFSQENKSLNQQNLANARFVSDALRRQYILGQVDTQTGLLFPEFNTGQHVVDDFPIPHDWRVVVGIDHGYDHPTAAVGIAIDPWGTMFVFADYLKVGASASDNAQGILDLVGGRSDKVRFVADTQLWNVDPRRPSESMATDYEREGVRPLIRANKQRQLSVDRIKQAMQFKQGMYDPQPKAKLYFMRNAARLIRSVDNMTWDRFNASQDDDLIDALRYAVMDLYHVRSSETPRILRKPIVLGGGYA